MIHIGKLRMFLIFILLFILASFLSVYSYGRFAKQAKGEPSYALPVAEAQTMLDRVLGHELREHPDESSLMLIPSNLDAFAIRATSAREAGRSLDLQYYIWHDDLTGQLLGRELIAAAERGVRVRVLLDDMNAHGNNSLLTALNLHPNISIRLFNPTRVRENRLMRGVEMLLRIFSVNRRMHNKAWIADGRVAVVGGRNIGDEYFDAAEDRNFFDVDLLIGGFAVKETTQIFDNFWNSDAAIPLEALAKGDEKTYERLMNKIHDTQKSISALPYVQKLEQAPSVNAIFKGQWKIHWTKNVHVYSDPAEKVFNQRQSEWLMPTIKPTLSGAKNQLNIISPYFVPGESGVADLSSLREKGVNIDILTNSLAATDVLLVHSGYAPYRKPLLEAGVNLYELKPFGEMEHSLLGSSGASLHTKAFLVDSQIGFVGSFNFDPRSAMLNTEMGVLFEEPSIVHALQQEFDERSSHTYSYKLRLENGAIRWQDMNEQNQLYLWDHEPESKWWQRTFTKIASYLPIESQL